MVTDAQIIQVDPFFDFETCTTFVDVSGDSGETTFRTNQRCQLTKVLIVDDMEGVRRGLVYALEDDYSICQAANGLEAISVAQTEQPDIIVMDLDMPVMDGVEATRQIKSHPQLSRIKVLAVSGQHNSEKSRLIQDNADAFIEKPFEISALVEAVRLLALK